MLKLSIMKKCLKFLLSTAILISVYFSFAQDTPVYPGVIKTAVAYEITKPLRDNPIVTSQEYDSVDFYQNNSKDWKINPNIDLPDFDNMPIDPGEQTFPGWKKCSKATQQNFTEQNSDSSTTSQPPVPDSSSLVTRMHLYQAFELSKIVTGTTTGFRF